MSKKHRRERQEAEQQEQLQPGIEEPAAETAEQPADGVVELVSDVDPDENVGDAAPKDADPVEEPVAEKPVVPPLAAAAPQTVTPKEPVAAPAPASKEKIMSADIIKQNASSNNAFAKRRALAAAAVRHTPAGQKVAKMFDDYKARMSVPSNDREENKIRIRMLQQILNAACPNTKIDLQTATDVARVVFDKLSEGWGTVYDDTTLFRMGDTLKGSAYDMDKLVLFFEAFVQMIEGVQEKKKVLFDDGRLSKVLRNQNMVIAMGRIRENINLRNGYGPNS